MKPTFYSEYCSVLNARRRLTPIASAVMLALVLGRTSAQDFAWITLSPPLQQGCSFVCVAPDIDGDGFNDILAANANWSIPAPPGQGWGGMYPGAGKVQVISGHNGVVIREHLGTSAFEGLTIDGWTGDVDGDARCDYIIFSGLLGQRIVSGATGVVGPPLPLFSAYPSVRGIGDVNGDGVSDFAVPTGGVVSVRSGVNASVLYSVVGWTGTGTVWQGFSIDRMGDVDGDGVGDFVFGSPTPDNFQFGSTALGSATLVSGATGFVLSTVTLPGTQTRFGRTVVAIGDVSGDGISDFFVNAPTLHLAWVFSGAAGTPLLYPLSPVNSTYPAYLSFGYYACATGDVDGDGWPDYAMQKESGLLSLRSGPTGAEIGLIPYPTTHALIGIGGVQDIDGDGYRDLLEGLWPTNQPAPNNTTAFAAVSMIPNGLGVSGTGCPTSTGAIPRIACGSRPLAGTSLNVNLSQGPAGALALLLVGVSTTQWNGFALPLDLAGQGLAGCQLMTSLDLVLPHLTVPADKSLGSATQAFSIPLGLTGSVFYAQWAIESPPGGIPPIALTPLLTTTIL